MNKENRLVKNVILYTIGNLGSKVLVMLIVPIYTHYMNPAEIGYYDLIVTLAGLICPVIMLSIHEGNLDKRKTETSEAGCLYGEAVFY